MDEPYWMLRFESQAELVPVVFEIILLEPRELAAMLGDWQMLNTHGSTNSFAQKAGYDI